MKNESYLCKYIKRNGYFQKHKRFIVFFTDFINIQGNTIYKNL